MARADAVIRLGTGQATPPVELPVQTGYDGFAELPRAQVDVTWSLPTGPVYTVKASGGDYTPAQFQSALNAAAAQASATIVIDEGLTITGSFTLPARTGLGWVYILSRPVYLGTFTKADGQRATPSDVAGMATVQTATANSPVFTAGSGAARYRLAGLALTTIAGSVGQQGGLMLVEPGSTRIFVDRCYAYAVPGTYWCRRAFAMNGTEGAVINSTVAGMVDPGSDSQAVWTITADVLRVENNYLEAASENFMAGGAGWSRTPNDITFRRNHVKKPLAWRNVYAVKNLLELKYAERVLIEQNVFDTTWNSAQSFAINILQINNGGPNPNSQQLRDIVFRWNRLTNNYATYQLNIASYAGGDVPPQDPAARITIRQNLFEQAKGDGVAGSEAGRGRYLIQGSSAKGPIAGLTLTRNTMLSGETWVYAMGLWDPGAASPPPPRGTLTLTGNLFGAMGLLWASNYPETRTNLTAQWETIVEEGNALHGNSRGGLLASTTLSGATNPQVLTAIKFVDVASGNYALASDSPFKGAGLAGGDPGVDYPTLAQYLAGVV